jgi:hypothetical protein
MGKGASRKIRGAELIKPDGQPDDELNEDEQDALFGQRKVKPKRKSSTAVIEIQIADRWVLLQHMG